MSNTHCFICHKSYTQSYIKRHMKSLTHIKKEDPIEVAHDKLNVKVEESYDSIDKNIHWYKKKFYSFHFFIRIDNHLINGYSLQKVLTRGYLPTDLYIMKILYFFSNYKMTFAEHMT